MYYSLINKTQNIAKYNKAEIIIQIFKILISDCSAAITDAQRHSQSLDVIPLLLYR